MNYAHTPGPWRWEVNEHCKQVRLCGGAVPYDLTVIEPVRWGMNSASFRLRDPALDGYQLMHPMQKWLSTVPGREHHKSWFQTVDHPDARLIAAAPDLLAAMKMLLREVDESGNGVATDFRWPAATATARAAIAKAEGR